MTELLFEARKLVKRYGPVTAVDGADFELRAGEVMAVIGDNGAGKSTLIKMLAGAVIPDSGELFLDGKPVTFKRPIDARRAGIETVYQDLAMAPALDIATNMYLGRERRKPGLLGLLLRKLDNKGMREHASEELTELGITTLGAMTQTVELLSGGQRQAVAVARAATWGHKVLILDEPTAALGVRQSGQVLDLIRRVRAQGTGVVLISHDMPSVEEVADRIHVMRLGRRVALTTPQEHTMSEVVALMTGALTIEESK
jgi:fructose transport system ATP-binding protein